MSAIHSREAVAAPEQSGLRYRYRAYLPGGPARALVLYLPHYGGTIEDWERSQLPELLARHGVASAVGLPIPEGTGYLDDPALGALLALIADAAGRAQCPPDALALGGFSAGGVGALRYAELAAAGALGAAPRPRALFAVDPPLDVRRWYRGLQLIVDRAPASPLLHEARAVTAMLREALGGTPDEAPEAYARISPVSAFATGGGNLRHLAGTPIRLYTEPDLHFWLEHGADMYCLNALDVSYAAAELRALGNAQAELIVTSGRGFRPDLGGIRLPHAWSIVDETDLAAWLLAMLGLKSTE